MAAIAEDMRVWAEREVLGTMDPRHMVGAKLLLGGEEFMVHKAEAVLKPDGTLAAQLDVRPAHPTHVQVSFTLSAPQPMPDGVDPEAAWT
jgi:hypothetical protein